MKQKFAHESPLAILSTLLKVTVLGKKQWEDIPGDGVPESGVILLCTWIQGVIFAQ